MLHDPSEEGSAPIMLPPKISFVPAAEPQTLSESDRKCLQYRLNARCLRVMQQCRNGRCPPSFHDTASEALVSDCCSAQAWS